MPSPFDTPKTFEVQMKRLHDASLGCHSAFSDSFHNASPEALTLIAEAAKKLEAASRLLIAVTVHEYSDDDRWQDA